MDGYQKAKDENKINSQYEKLAELLKKSADESGKDVKDNPRGTSASPQSGTTPMEGKLMTWTQMLESMNEISDSIKMHDEDMMNDQITGTTTDVPTLNDSGSNDDELLAQLDKIFTPVLIMQGFETDSSDKIQEAMSEAAVFTEKSVIQFDNDTRMAQLIAVCARLIQRQKNTEKYRMFAKAYEIKKQMDLEMQKEEYDSAKLLAQKYLDNVATYNNSPVARNSAKALSSATQH